MKKDKEVKTMPEPDEETPAHGQSPSSSLTPLSPPVISDDSSGVESCSLSQSLQNLSQSNPRRYGGIYDALQMAALWAGDVDTKIGDLSHAFKDLQTEENNVRKELAKAREENVAHTTRAEVQQEHKSLTAAATLASPALIGLSLDQLSSQHWGLGVALLVIGGFLGLAVYVSKGKGK